MSCGCFGGCFRGLGRRVRGAYRSIQERLAHLRRNLHHGDQQGGTPNTLESPHAGLPLSIQHVLYEHFFTEETTTSTSVQEIQRTTQQNSKYRSVSQPPSGSSHHDSSSLDQIVSSTVTPPLNVNIVSSSSPPSVSGQQDSSFSIEHSKAMMLIQEAVTHMKNKSAFDEKTFALMMKAYEYYKKDRLVSQSNRGSATFRESSASSDSATSRESATFRESATSSESVTFRESATSREPASYSRNSSQEDGRDTLVSRSSGVFDDSFIFSDNEHHSSRSYAKARRRYQASPMDRSLMRLIEFRSPPNLWTLIHICRRFPYLFKHLPKRLFNKGLHPSIILKQSPEETSRKNMSYIPSPLSYDHTLALL